ncbi:MAG: LysM peptidoglycan-binding domain-containing protein [Candidatus Omnitrophica bacterium]|nr:LysM peptidoglycan-binding domain-containing protein [Candidatus Omnitrophota bacterium]
MKGIKIIGLLALGLVFLLSGCVARTYEMTKDRVDQDLTGNRGYIQGSMPPKEDADRKSTRTLRVFEIEMRNPLNRDKKSKGKTSPAHAAEMEEIVIEEPLGNRGYITQSIALEETQPAMEKYTVQKNDTLQKISQKFFGTTTKWQKIYDANRDILKGPNKIYPGQVINIPVDGKVSGSTPAKHLK